MQILGLGLTSCRVWPVAQWTLLWNQGNSLTKYEATDHAAVRQRRERTVSRDSFSLRCGSGWCYGGLKLERESWRSRSCWQLLTAPEARKDLVPMELLILGYAPFPFDSNPVGRGLQRPECLITALIRRKIRRCKPSALSKPLLPPPLLPSPAAQQAVAIHCLSNLIQHAAPNILLSSISRIQTLL